MGMLYGHKADNMMIPQAPTSLGPVLVNGKNPDGSTGYLNAPARDEDQQYRMDNLLVPSRYSVWSTRVGNADGSIKIHVDLSGGATGANLGGANKTVTFIAIHGLRGLGGSVPPTFVGVNYRTRAQGYSATTYTPIVLHNTGQLRDSGTGFTIPPFRYLEIDLAYGVEGIAIGGIFIGNLMDLGIYWSSDGGSQYESEGNLLWSRTAGGHASAVKRGDPWARWTLRFNGVPTTIRQKILSDFGTTGVNRGGDPITIVDESAVTRQYVVTGGPISTQRFNNLYDVSVEMEQLG